MSQHNAPIELFSPERLGLRHLMLWMLFTALVMVAYQVLEAVDEEMLGKSFVPRVTQLVYAVVYGAALVGLSITLRRWLRPEASLAPGHCLLLMAGFGAFVDGIAILLAQTISDWSTPAMQPYGEMLIHQSAGHALVVMLAAPVFLTSGLPARWKPLLYTILLAFLAYSALCLALLLMLLGIAPQILPWSLPQWAIVVASILCVPLLLWALWLDLCESRHYDWLHWLGIIATASLTIVELGQFVQFLFLE